MLWLVGPTVTHVSPLAPAPHLAPFHLSLHCPSRHPQISPYTFHTWPHPFSVSQSPQWPQEKPTLAAMVTKALLSRAAWSPTTQSLQSRTPGCCPGRPRTDLPSCLCQYWSFPLQSPSLPLHQVFLGPLCIPVLTRAPFKSADHVPGTGQRALRATSPGIVPPAHEVGASLPCVPGARHGAGTQGAGFRIRAGGICMPETGGRFWI